MIRIKKAYCIELEQVVTPDEARREYLSREVVEGKFAFLCSEEACREAGVRVIGAAYRTAATEGVRYVAAHFKRQDAHLDGCVWIDDEPAPILGDGHTDRSATTRRAKRKLTDFVDVFDPRPDDEIPLTMKGTDGNHDIAGVGWNSTKKRGERDRGHDGSLTRTSYLDRLVDCYLEAKATLSDEEFRSLNIEVEGVGTFTLNGYFRLIKYVSLTTRDRVLFGGATFVGRYGLGFKLKFFDKVGALPVFLYVSPDTMRQYRYRNYLSRLIDQHESVRYFRVFALGSLAVSPKGNSIDLVIDDLRHLAIVLGRKVDTGEEVQSNPTASSSNATR